MMTAHAEPVPEQPPPVQPEKSKLVPGASFSPTTAPVPSSSSQTSPVPPVPLHAIVEGASPVTVPDAGVGEIDTARWKRTGDVPAAQMILRRPRLMTRLAAVAVKPSVPVFTKVDD